MNVDLSKMKTSWWEDENGELIDMPEEIAEAPKNGRYFVTCDPSQLVTECMTYSYNPKNWFMKLICRNNRIWNYFNNKKRRTFRPLYVGHNSYGTMGEKCIVAMVNAGRYTLSQAIWVYCNSCERCTNVLLHRYLNGEDGYKEYSPEWYKANTECMFCEDMKSADPSDR